MKDRQARDAIMALITMLYKEKKITYQDTQFVYGKLK